MHRFHLSPEQCRGTSLTLAGMEAHHAVHVLRLRKNETVIVLDGAGAVLTCAVEVISKKAVTLVVNARERVAPPPCDVTLVQAIPKGKIIESVIQKATELGVRRIVPLLTERVVTHLDAESATGKAGKWQAIAIESIKQSGNPWLPKVEVPVRLPEWLLRRDAVELELIGSLRPGAQHPRDCFDSFVQQHQRLPKTLAVWIGPEGDFTTDEVASVCDAGARPITLGQLVLRVETAATYCLAVVNYEMQARTNGLSLNVPRHG